MEKPQFVHYKNAEFIQFIKNIRSIVTKYDPVALKIVPQAAHLDERYEVCKKLFIIDQGNAITEEIKEYDRQRDIALIGINLHVDSYEKHFEEEKREVAALLRRVLDRYGRDLYRRSFAEESAGILRMVQEVRENLEVTTAVAVLGLTDWFAHLEQMNDLFNEKYLERNKAYAEAPKEKFADVRKETEQAYEELVRHLNAHALVTPSAAHDKVIREINTLVKGYNVSARGRSTE